MPKLTLRNSRFGRRAVVVDVPQPFPTRSAGELGPAPPKAPVVHSLEKWEALLLLFLPKIGLVHSKEGYCALVAGVKVCVRRVEKLIVEVQTPVASSTVVNCHS